MRGEQAIFNLEIKKKRGLSINPDIHHSKVSSSGTCNLFKCLCYRDLAWICESVCLFVIQ